MRTNDEPYVLTFGESMGLIGPGGDTSLVHAPNLTMGIGGAESNVAIGLRRLDTAAVWVGRVGDDPPGRMVLRELRAEDVDVRAVVDPHASTALMLREHDGAGITRIWYYRTGSAGSRLRSEDIPLDLVTDAALVHISGITASLSASARAATENVIAAARAANVPISFDVNHRAALWRDRDPGELYRQLAACSTIIFAGVQEARLIAPRATDDELVPALVDLGPEQVIITLGSGGCRANVDGIDLRQEAVPIDVVDSVGAGDAFVAGYLAEMIAGAPPRQRLRTAVTAGAYACSRRGDWEGMPRRAELRNLDLEDPVVR